MSNLMESNTCPDGYRALNTSELRELLQNDDKMDQIIRLNEKFQELQVDREMLLTTNRSLAEDSLARRPRLCNGKLQLAEKYRELSNLATTCWEKQSQLEAHVQRHSLQTAQNLLQEEVARAEEHSEELLEKFMEGNVSLDQFLGSFQSSRKMYHIRRAQVEKMQEVAQEKRQPGKTKRAEESKVPEVKKDSEQPQEPQRPNGFVAQGPLRVFQVRYGLTPAILLPHYPVSPPASAPCYPSSTPTPEPQPGQTHILSPSTPLPGHAQPVGLRVIGQLPGGWPANGRPVRVQQLYRPNPQQPEPPYR
ncbi:Vacuolar protein sorting-associated protein 37D [Larimichthys crocea]|uniref:Vacuolar protein sorting-associated protein 37D n=1 Tax=Larimichthys crocea TaxID=215358 RepID=A0A0F8AXU0_LARCR|nr:vacuolar protein sorting-associated protein 37D isoform X1 [Larimichthys crocea]KAE8287666.1 Vacuolar protein sorting-associated protein 37D [Larimichthys crocea]